MICGKNLKLGFMCSWEILGFCSISWNWVKLARVIGWLVIYNFYSACYDDQLVQLHDFFLKKIKVFALC